MNYCKSTRRPLRQLNHAKYIRKLTHTKKYYKFTYEKETFKVFTNYKKNTFTKKNFVFI